MVPVPLSSWGGDLAGKHFSPDTGWDSTRCEPRTPRPGRRTAQARGCLHTPEGSWYALCLASGRGTRKPMRPGRGLAQSPFTPT